MSTLTPLHNKVLVKKDKNKEKTDGGLFLPDSVTNEKVKRPTTGTVVAVGEGITTVHGAFIPTKVRVGQRVYFAEAVGTDAKEFGEDLLILSENEIMAVFEEDELV